MEGDKSQERTEINQGIYNKQGRIAADRYRLGDKKIAWNRRIGTFKGSELNRSGKGVMVSRTEAVTQKRRHGPPKTISYRVRSRLYCLPTHFQVTRGRVRTGMCWYLNLG